MKRFDIAIMMIVPLFVVSCTNGVKKINETSEKQSPISPETATNIGKVPTRSDGTNANRRDTTRGDIVSIGSSLTPREVQELIKLHNQIRADVGVGPLTWSSELAVYAQKWADHLATMGCEMKHRPDTGAWQQEHGENLFMGTVGYYGVGDAVKAWKSEKEHYKGEALNLSNWYPSGHYTQIVWRDTKQIGCAKVVCNGNIIVVCNYDPPGNVLGKKPY